MDLLESGLDPIPSILDDDPIDRPFAPCPLRLPFFSYNPPSSTFYL